MIAMTTSSSISVNPRFRMSISSIRGAVARRAAHTITQDQKMIKTYFTPVVGFFARHALPLLGTIVNERQLPSRLV